MPPPPLVQSPRRQRQLVAVLMCLVFMASLGVAYLFGEARIGRRDIQFQPVQVNRLEVQLPAHWQRDRAAEQAMDMEGARFYRNPDRPAQTLRLLTVRAAAEPQPPQAVLNRVMPLLLGPQQYRNFQPLSVQAPQSGSAMQVVDVAGVSHVDPTPQDIDPEAVRLHLVAAMTLDNRIHWVLHMADRPEANELPTRALERNAMLFRRIQRSAAVTPPPESEAQTSGDAPPPAATIVPHDSPPDEPTAAEDSTEPARE